MGTVDTKTFNMALGVAGVAIAGRGYTPVLMNALLAAKDGILTIAGTNLAVGISSRIGYEGEDFSITLPHTLLNNWTNLASSPTLEFKIDEPTQTVTLVSGRSTSKIKGISADEFPSLPTQETELATIHAATLAQALKAVVLAAAFEHTNPILQGVLFRFSGHECVLAAIDGYCLSVQVIELSTPIDGVQSFIIPGESVKSLIKMLPKKGDAVVTCGVSKHNANMIFKVEDTEFTTRIIDGQFPDYERFVPLPSDQSIEIKCDKTGFQQALKRIALYLDKSNTVVRVDTDDEAIRLSSANVEIGNADETVEAEINKQGMPKTSAFNVGYLNEALQAIDSEKLILQVIDERSPLVFRPDVLNTKNFFLVMPMRVPERQ